MKLNRIEKWAMNNPIRAAAQRRFEAPRLLKMGGPLPPNSRVLEIGCGRGVGSEILFEQFGAQTVHAFDLDEDMVTRAGKRLEKYGDRVKLWTGSATEVPYESNAYDAVFDFGIIHHIPNWRDAIKEAHRVLKPGGRFYAEEVLRRMVLHPITQALAVHPLEDRFDVREFRAALEEVGFEVVAERTMGEWLGWFVSEKRD